MMNSVTPSAPRCSVSARVHIRPRTSLGNRALSKIDFAVSPACARQFGFLEDISERAIIPANIPFVDPDFSNSAEYSFTLSGVNGGTRTGPPLA